MNLNRARMPRLSASALAVMASMLTPVWAAAIDTGVPDLKVRWDNTIKYGAGFRLKDPSQSVAASAVQPNVDAGDMAFKQGLINNRIDILSELDASYKNFGARVSGAAWYDSVYRQNSNDYPAGGAPNTLSAAGGGPNNVFTPQTRRLMGQKPSSRTPSSMARPSSATASSACAPVATPSSTARPSSWAPTASPTPRHPWT